MKVNEELDKMMLDEIGILKRQLGRQVMHNQYLEKMFQLQWKVRHDLRTHLVALEYLHQEGDHSGFIQYLEELRENACLSNDIICSGNSVLDALLTDKIIELKREGVKIQSEVSMPENLERVTVEVYIQMEMILDYLVDLYKNQDMANYEILLNINFVQNVLFFTIKLLVETLPEPSCIWKDEERKEYVDELKRISEQISESGGCFDIECTESPKMLVLTSAFFATK